MALTRQAAEAYREVYVVRFFNMRTPEFKKLREQELKADSKFVSAAGASAVVGGSRRAGSSSSSSSSSGTGARFRGTPAPTLPLPPPHGCLMRALQILTQVG